MPQCCQACKDIIPVLHPIVLWLGFDEKNVAKMGAALQSVCAG